MEILNKNLFGEDVVIEDGRRVHIFENDDILETAFIDFRQRGFPYPEIPLFKQKQILNELVNLPLADCINSTLGYRIADTYHRHRFACAAIGMSSPYDSFLDDKRLKKVLKMQLEQSNTFDYGYLGFMSLVNGTQACSNFRPAFAKMIYNKHAKPGARVFDSSTGFGGRLIGFLASHCAEYIGTDPNTKTFNANVEIVKNLGRHKEIYLYNLPIEDLTATEIHDTCDFSFTSPPYFKKELYSTEDTQSCNRYPEYKKWIDGFLRPMMLKNMLILKSGGKCIINIEDVKIKNVLFDLVQSTVEIAKSLGFIHNDSQFFNLQARTMMNEGVKQVVQAKESVLVFTKP